MICFRLGNAVCISCFIIFALVAILLVCFLSCVGWLFGFDVGVLTKGGLSGCILSLQWYFICVLGIFAGMRGGQRAGGSDI